MKSTSTVVTMPPDNETAAMGFINNGNIDGGVARASLSSQVFKDIKLKRITPTLTNDDQPSNIFGTFNHPVDATELVLGSGGPVTQDAATYATTAYYALGGGAVPVGLSEEFYAYAPTSAYFINSDLSMSVIAEDSIRVEDINLIPQDLSPITSSSISLALSPVVGNIPPLDAVASASAPCNDTIAVLTLNPVTLYIIQDYSLSSVAWEVVKAIPISGASSVAPEYQVEYVSDSLLFIGLRNSTTGYWVNIETSTVQATTLGGPLISCYAGTKQFGVACVVCAVVSGAGFSLCLNAYGDSASATLITRSGTFGDLFMHGPMCMVASYSATQFTIEKIYDFVTTESKFTDAPLLANTVPRKVFACNGEVFVLFVSPTTAAHPILYHAATNTFLPELATSDSFSFNPNRRVRHLATSLGHLFYAGTGQNLLRVSTSTNPITAIPNSSALKYPTTMRGNCVGSNGTTLNSYITTRSKDVNIYIRVVTNQSEAGLVRPWPEISTATTENRIYPRGAGGYYPFTLVEKTADQLHVFGVVGIVERQDKKMAVQLVRRDSVGYLEPVLTYLDDFVPDNSYPDGAITYAAPIRIPLASVVGSSTDLNGQTVRLETIDGMTARVHDPGYFRWQENWYYGFSSIGRDFSVAHPNPYHTEFYANWDCAIAVVWTSSNTTPAPAYTVAVAIPGWTHGSITRGTDLSANTMDVSGSKTAADQVGEEWFGALHGAEHTLSNTGGIFGFSSVLDTNA